MQVCPNFFLKHTFSEQPYVYSSGEVSPRKIRETLKVVRKKELYTAHTGNRLHINENLRNSKICLISPRGSAFEEMKQFAQSANERLWKFPTKFHYTSLQYAQYEKGDHFAWHHDVHDPQIQTRILSVILMVNSQNDFTGGRLELKDWNGKIHHLKLEFGQMVVYPACFFHRVTKVKSGVRQTLGLSIALKSPFQIGKMISLK